MEEEGRKDVQADWVGESVNAEPVGTEATLTPLRDQPDQ